VLEGNPISVDGIVIPSDHPLFLAIIAIHVAAGLTCVISGIFAMFARKQKGLHTKAGKIYYISIWIVFLTAVCVAIMRWEEDYHLFLLGLASFGCAFAGRRAALRHGDKWIIYHICGMGLSYIFLLIAFYVDNGKFLPGWKDLPHYLYWLIPLLAGVPLLAWTLYSNPLSRIYFGASKKG
jgi:hypothetical protein